MPALPLTNVGLKQVNELLYVFVLQTLLGAKERGDRDWLINGNGFPLGLWKRPGTR